MNFDLLERRVDQMGLQVVLKADELNLKDFYDRFKSRGYKIYVNPTFEDLERKVEIGERVVLLLPHLMDGYLSIVRERRLKAILLTLGKATTSKLATYVFAEVK